MYSTISFIFICNQVKYILGTYFFFKSDKTKAAICHYHSRLDLAISTNRMARNMRQLQEAACCMCTYACMCVNAYVRVRVYAYIVTSLKQKDARLKMVFEQRLTQIRRQSANKNLAPLRVRCAVHCPYDR